MSTPARPRSLADDFRRRARHEVAFLLERRADLLHPTPESLSQLAMRASTGPSVRMALHQVDARTLAVAQAIAQEPVTTDPQHLQTRLLLGRYPALVDEPPVAHGLSELHRLGLLWHDGARYHPVREFVAVVRTVAPGMPSEPVTAAPVAPAVGSSLDIAQVNRSAGLHGLLAVEDVRQLLDAFDTTTLGLTRDGKVVVRDLHAMAEVVQWGVAQTVMWLEVAWLAGLLGPSVDGTEVLPTDSAAQWSTQPTADSWVQLLAAWYWSDRDWSAFNESDPDIRPAVFGDSHVLSSLVGLRTRWAQALMQVPQGASVANAVEIVRSEQPLAWLNAHRLRHLLADMGRQSDMLGFTSHGAISTLGRLLAEAAPAERLASEAATLLPEVRDRIIVQADLTIIAPTPLPHELARTLRSFAAVESTGGATVYRLSASSLAAGLAAGTSADEVLDILTRHSDVPVPQPVEFLVRDTAASFGRVRVGQAVSYLTTEDSHAMTAVLAALGPLSAQVQRISDTVAVSELPPEQMLGAARTAGFPVTDEVSEPKRSATAPPPRLPSAVHGASSKRVETVLDALMAVSHDARSPVSANIPDVDRMHSAQIQNLLTRASEEGRRVWLRYADNAGASSVRLVSGLILHSGAVEALDVERGSVRRFALSRIAGARVDVEQEG